MALTVQDINEKLWASISATAKYDKADPFQISLYHFMDANIKKVLGSLDSVHGNMLYNRDLKDAVANFLELYEYPPDANGKKERGNRDTLFASIFRSEPYHNWLANPSFCDPAQMKGDCDKQAYIEQYALLLIKFYFFKMHMPTYKPKLLECKTALATLIFDSVEFTPATIKQIQQTPTKPSTREPMPQAETTKESKPAPPIHRSLFDYLDLNSIAIEKFYKPDIIRFMVCAIGVFKYVAGAIPTESVPAAAVLLATFARTRGTPILAWRTLMQIMIGILAIGLSNSSNRALLQIEPYYDNTNLAAQRYLADILPFTVLCIVHSFQFKESTRVVAFEALTPMAAVAPSHILNYWQQPAEPNDMQELDRVTDAMITRLKIEIPVIRSLPEQAKSAVLTMYDWASNPFPPSFQIAHKLELAQKFIPSLRLLDDGNAIKTVTLTPNAEELAELNEYDSKLCKKWNDKGIKRKNYYVLNFPDKFETYNDFQQVAYRWADELTDTNIASLYKTNAHLQKNTGNCVIPDFEQHSLLMVQEVFVYFTRLIQSEYTPNAMAVEQWHAKAYSPGCLHNVLDFHEKQTISLLPLLANAPPLTRQTVSATIREYDSLSLQHAFEAVPEEYFSMQGQITARIKDLIEESLTDDTGISQDQNLLDMLAFADHMPFQDHGDMIQKIIENKSRYHETIKSFQQLPFIEQIVPAFMRQQTPLFAYYAHEWLKDNEDYYPSERFSPYRDCGKTDTNICMPRLASIRENTLKMLSTQVGRDMLLPMTKHNNFEKMYSNKQYDNYGTAKIIQMYNTNNAFYWGNLLAAFLDYALAQSQNPSHVQKLGDLLAASKLLPEIAEKMPNFYDYVYFCVFLVPGQNPQHVEAFLKFAGLIKRVYPAFDSLALQNRNLLLPSS